MDKEDEARIHTTIRRKEIMSPVATQMDLEITILRKGRQKDKYHRISLIYRI